MTVDEFDWTPEQRAALEALARPEPPPAGLEERVVSTLIRERRLRSRHDRHGRLAWAGLAASAVLVIAAFLAGRHLGNVPPSATGTSQPRYVLLLYDSAQLDPRLEAERVAEYRQWAGGLRREGRFISGEKLAERRVMLGATAGTEAEPGRALAGFFVFEAASIDEALRIARECPHLKHGGRVELRPIDPT